MKVTAIADLHGYLPEIPETDLLLIGGDVCPVWDHERRFQANWLRSTFADWLQDIPAQVIVGIAGNHDFVMDNKVIGNQLPWVYLHDETKTVKVSDKLKVRDVNIYGSPFSNKFGHNWAFNSSEGELGEKYRKIPRDVDIILTHGPAFGYGDLVPGKVWKGNAWVSERVGSTSLTNQVTYDLWPNLKLLVAGHIHEGYGTYPVRDDIVALNVSYMNEEYKPVNPPITVTL